MMRWRSRNRRGDGPSAPERGTPDILWQEKARRRSRGRVTRFFSPGWWLEGRRGAAALALFLVIGGGLFILRFLNGGVGGGDPVYVDYSSAAPVADAGRRLTGVEHGMASAFGEPLYLGRGGLPVVEHAATGEVRELTPMEEAYYELSEGTNPPFLPTGENGVVWNPGPSGWGMWWKDTSEADALKPVRRYPRLPWRDKQEVELQEALRLLSGAVDAMSAVNLEAWDSTVMPRVMAWVDRLKEAYPLGGEWGHWYAVPGQWVCDLELEAQLTMGITQGCPPDTYGIALAESWRQIGRTAEHLEGMARVGRQMDGLAYDDILDSGLYRTQYFYFITLADILEDLAFTLNVLVREAVGQELPVDVGI